MVDLEVSSIGHLVGEAFDFYYDECASNGELTDAGKNYESVKKALLDRFGKSKTPDAGFYGSA